MGIDEIVDEIDAKLVGPGRDEDKISRSELAFMLAHSFDDHLREEDFTSFVSQASSKEWQQTVDALREVGATEYADIFTRFIVADGTGFSAQPMLSPGSPDFEYSEDYDESFSDVRNAADGETETAYMRNILTAYARKIGLSSQ